MKNLHKLLVVLISIAFISSGVFAQSDMSPKLKDQLEVKVKPPKAEIVKVIPGGSDQAPAPVVLEDAQKGIFLEKTPGNYVTEVAPNANKIPYNSEAMFDLQFDFAVGVGGGEAGIETDGNYIYTSMWNGAGDFQRYDIDGTWVETITVAGSSGCRDIAYDGTYFYGGAASTTIFEMDLATATMISTFTGPAACRAVAYDEDEDAFYCNNWSDDITKFNKAGANLGSFAVGASAASYYGMAYQGGDYCGDGPFLWGHSQTGATQNELIQMELPSGTETGLTFDVGSVANVGAGIAGGLAISSDLVSGTWTFLGTSQNEDIWGLELCLSGPLPTVDVGVSAILSPMSGTGLTATEAVTVTVKNFGTDAQSNIPVSFTLDGGAAVNETVSATINGGETYDYTFAATVDLSVPGDYAIDACTALGGDENAANDCKSATVSNLTQAWVYPQSVDDWTGTCTVTAKTDVSAVRAWGGDGLTNEQGWMMFDISSLPANSLINWVKFHGYVTATNYPYWSITPMPINPVTSAAADIFAAAQAGSGIDLAYAYNNESSTFAPGWHEYDLVGTAPDDLANAISQGWFAVGIYERDGSATYYLELDGWNETEVPWLEIDYTVLDFGILNGTVTEMASGNPIENAAIHAVGPNFTYDVMTASDGTYEINPAQDGVYDITCTMDGYNIENVGGIIVVAGGTTTQDFDLTAPTMDIDPLSISITIEPNATSTEPIDISNNGDGLLSWNGQLELLTDATEDMFDVIFDVPVGVGGGEAGIETDGSYIYTSMWNGAGEFQRYTMDGTWVETITVAGSTGCRDIAYDGTYFYGGAASTTIFEMDLANATMISTFTGPAACRAVAYNENDDVFYCNNWSDNITIFDKTGANLGNFAIGASAASYYGFAYDNYSSPGTPFLWGHSQTGATQNELIQMELPSGNETGLTFDVGSVTNVGAGIAGGLAIDEHIVPGSYSFLGTSQNENIWALELGGSAAGAWITIDPTSGDTDPGNTDIMTVSFDATDIIAGTVKTANIHFTSDPDVGTVVVPVSMTVGTSDFGFVNGNVVLDGVAPYNIGDVTEVLVEVGPYMGYPDSNGDYSIETYPGTYDVTATLYGYDMQMASGIVVAEGATVIQDFTMPCLYGEVSGTVTEFDGGAPVAGATVDLVGTDFETTTAADGTYSILVEAGTYDVHVQISGFGQQTATGTVISAQANTTVDFALEVLDGIIVVIDLDPTPNPQITDVVQGFFPGGLVEYTTTIDGYPLDEEVQTVFLLLGIYANNYTLLESDATVITSWIDTYPGRNLYMEGGDTWAFDTPTTLHGYFNINPIADGSGDLATVNGIDSFWAQFSWSYVGENNWIDQLEAIAPAINVCENPDVGYFNAVAYDEGTYKTVGASFEVTGLDDGTGSFDMGVASIMGYFGYPVFTYGDLDGFVYDGLGNPVEGAMVSAGGLGSTMTLSDGSYLLEDLLVGTWDVTASKDNYQPSTETVTILEDQTTTQDFTLEGPGSLSGTVTEVGGGNVEGALIDVGAGTYTTTTAADGTYSFPEILSGDWDVVCSKDGYNTEMATVNISQGNNTVQDFALTAPQLVVTPLDLQKTLEPNEIGTELVNISNPGNGDVDWSASLSIIGDNGEDMWDVLMDVPVGVGGGEAGIETDGSYIYTSMWNGAGEFQRYMMDGTWVETITVAGSAGCRDIAYDGTYFYGGAASTTIFEMDLANATMISTFTGPAACRAVAYNENEDVFYCNNWSDNITKFDKSGANLGNFAIGASAASYYGFAYDGYSTGNPFLWGHSQTGATQNELIQMELPSGTETGLTFDVGSVTNVGAGIAGGLAIDDHIVSGVYAFLGTSQNENLWALELTESATWISIDPTSGTVVGGSAEDMTATFDATGLLPGVYEALINFSTTPNVGSPVVEVTLTVEGLIPAINLMAEANCTDVDLTWEMPTGGNPDSWNIYRDGTLLGDATTMEYSDEMVDPEVEYTYNVTAVYGAEESQPTPDVMITVATPGDLEPEDPTAVHQGGGDVLVSWDAPLACLAPDSYNIYRDGAMIGSSTTMEYTDPGLTSGFYEYYVVAVYYFGESGNSAPAYVLVGVGELSASQFKIYPNPAKDMVNVRSDYHINSIQILNNVGQLVIEKSIESNSFQINVSQYERGIYYIKLSTDEGTVLRKIAVD